MKTSSSLVSHSPGIIITMIVPCISISGSIWADIALNCHGEGIRMNREKPGINEPVPGDNDAGCDREIEGMWIAEARRRLELYKKGECGTRSTEEVFALVDCNRRK